MMIWMVMVVVPVWPSTLLVIVWWKFFFSLSFLFSFLIIHSFIGCEGKKILFFYLVNVKLFEQKKKNSILFAFCTNLILWIDCRKVKTITELDLKFLFNYLSQCLDWNNQFDFLSLFPSLWSSPYILFSYMESNRHTLFFDGRKSWPESGCNDDLIWMKNLNEYNKKNWLDHFEEFRFSLFSWIEFKPIYLLIWMKSIPNACQLILIT